MKTLYVIHGWTYTVAPWQTTIEILKRHGIEIKMLHVPGLTSKSSKVWTIKDYVKWADENIPDGAIALGHSNGGRILLNLLSEKPDKLKHVVLLDAAGVYEESRKRDVARKISKLAA
ncbi:MAG: alpha/beta fold hydrolase, partial [Desulfovibrio sp.]|nr:alpha/beta fold hydrolase [Desulfovibrio sp.]